MPKMSKNVSKYMYINSGAVWSYILIKHHDTDLFSSGYYGNKNLNKKLFIGK
jgi:hypothetical protein